MSEQTQKSLGYCAICTPVGKICPTEYPIPLKSDWSDSEEEEKDTNEQNKVEEEVQDWDSDLQKQKEIKEKEVKNINIKIPHQAQNPCSHSLQILKAQKHSPHSPPKF